MISKNLNPINSPLGSATTSLPTFQTARTPESQSPASFQSQIVLGIHIETTAPSDASLLFGEDGSTLTTTPFIEDQRKISDLFDTPPEPARILFEDHQPSIFDNLLPS